MVVVVVILLAHQQKAAGRKTRLDIQNYGCNGNLLCYHGVVERNRISSLQRHGKALEKECCLPGIFCDSGDTPANFIKHYYCFASMRCIRCRFQPHD